MAIARSRLRAEDAGEAAEALRGTLERTRRASERHLMVRCLEGLAEIALGSGDAEACGKCGDELLEIAVHNGLSEMEATARRWRGEALLARKSYAEAEQELRRAASAAEVIGRVRLQMDVESALARLSRAQGRSDAPHAAKSRAIAENIRLSVAASGLKPRLEPLG